MIKIVNYRNKLKDKKFIDLFAGIGGFRLALESFGARCVYTSEWDKNSQELYEKNFGDLPNGDITQINEKNIPKHDILCAGFPCQAFSISGKQRGFEDTRGTLFFDVARIAKFRKPELILLENVKNFERHDEGRTLNTVKKVLEDIGYNIFYKVLNSSDFGIPQKRERIFILGIKKNVVKYEFPQPLHINVSLKDLLLNDDELTEDLFIYRTDVKLKKIPTNSSDIFGNTPNRPIRIGTINNGGQGERIYHPSGHAITLTAYGGGVAAKTGAYLINNKIRKLHPRECARLMGFPDSYELPNNKNKAWKQFGDSVVVDIVQIIIKDLIEKEIL